MRFKNSLFIILILSLLNNALSAQENPAYQLYNEKGKAVDYGKMLKKLTEADIVFFGELHDNPICHWLQLELSQDLYEARDSQLILGAEFFETDDQLILDEFLSGLISEKNFEKEAKLWPNYSTDYRPLIQFANEKQLPFIATNVPRRYASLLYKKGMETLEKLNNEAKALMTPLPFEIDMELPSYKAMLEMGAGHGSEQMVQAQALKDATMAHFILENFEPQKLFLHFNGAYHSNSKEGIIWYLLQENPDLKIVNIASVMQESVMELEEGNQALGDFILCIPENMTRTH
ncbi:MAG: ChaN family lipoprotein [Chitinophagales bacterium]